MRIITGEFKGRRLFSPKDDKIRPTSDKIKEAMFSILENVSDFRVVDLFCGTGSLGLEAISRGAKFVYFYDNSKESVALTKKNIDLCKANDRAQVMLADWKTALDNTGKSINLILIDPPYENDFLNECLMHIVNRNILSKDGTIVIEYSGKPEIINNIQIETDTNLYITKHKRYSKKGLIFLKKHEKE